MRDARPIKSGRRRNITTTLSTQQTPPYTPSFVENKSKTRKRSTVESGSSLLVDWKENNNLGVSNLVSNRVSSTSLPDIHHLSESGQETFLLSPRMNKRITPTNNVGAGRRGFLGYSNGPVTSSSLTGSRRRHTHATVSPNVHFDKDTTSNITINPTPTIVTASPSIGSSDKKFDFFDSKQRPTAPVRQEVNHNFNNNRKEKHSASPNHMSLDNWLKSLPDTLSRESSGKVKPLPNENVAKSSNEVEVNEIEDFEEESGCIQNPKTSIIKPKVLGTPISLEIARDLKSTMFGQLSSMFPPGWLGQAFVWNKQPQLSFGLVQSKGGPCGVMAAVQAMVIKVLLRGSSQFNVNPCDKFLKTEISERDRNIALAAAMSEVLVRCGSGSYTVTMSGMRKHFSSAGRMRADGITETLNIYTFTSSSSLFDFLLDHSGFMTGSGNNAVICFLYSCLLTRGIANVKRDMDTDSTPLMAAHGYCSQEMVNLITTGLATSNVFDGDITLGSGSDATLLKGIKEQSEIGLLSLFEHYKSCNVGNNLKCPQYPIWLICSESHFTVLWSNEATDRNDDNIIELYYYDGLSGQDSVIHLSVDTTTDVPDKEVSSTIEYCIRTKWTGATVDWNGAEKIL